MLLWVLGGRGSLIGKYLHGNQSMNQHFDCLFLVDVGNATLNRQSLKILCSGMIKIYTTGTLEAPT